MESVAPLALSLPPKGFEQVTISDEHPSEKETKTVQSIDKSTLLCPKLEGKRGGVHENECCTW